MTAEIKTDQRITRLTPLADVLAHIDSHVKPVAPRIGDVMAAHGFTLAEDVFSASALPSTAIALRDGFAVEAEATRDASSYSPVVLPELPTLLDAGDKLPADTDAILSHDAITIRGATTEIMSPATPGDGILSKGADIDPANPLMRVGRALRASDIAVLSAAGVSTVSIRSPRIAIVLAGRRDDMTTAAIAWLARVVTAAGGAALAGHQTHDLGALLRETEADAVIAIGGTGSGRNDDAITTLAQAGTVSFHGIAIAPGETAAFGFAQSRPVLLIPGRLDAALACWLTMGDRVLCRLAGRQPDDTERTARLSRKVASSLGMAEIIPVTCKGAEAEPLASGYLPLQTLARADGWILVPAQSEGYPAGTAVTVRPLP
jgi:molybdopterin biosynthesis enzyme